MAATKMPVDDQKLFRELGEHSEQLKALARSDEEIKESIKARSVESQEQHLELVTKFDALANDMRQIEWIRRDHTDLKKLVLDIEDAVRANRSRLEAIEAFVIAYKTLQINERLSKAEGYILGRQETESRRKWLRRLLAMAATVGAAVLGAVATAIGVIEGWIQLFPHHSQGPQ